VKACWRALAALALATIVGFAVGQAAPAGAAQNERGSAIGTPLPVGKVEPAPIAPPPYSDAEKAALAKLEAATSALAEMRTALSEEVNRVGILASWLTALALLQLFLLALQLFLLGRAGKSKAKAAAEAAAPPPVEAA